MSVAVDRALALIQRALRLSALTLHPAGAAVPSQRDAGGYLLAVPIRVGGEVQVLTAEADRPFDAALADTVVELASVFAELAAADPPAGRSRAATQAVLDLEADRAGIAARLDGVADALVAAKHAATDPAAVDAVEHALTLLRREQRRLRAETLDAGLAAALRRNGTAVVGDEGRLASLPPALAVAVERVAEALSWQAVSEQDDPGQISVEVTDLVVKFRLDSAEKMRDASELDRWGRRVSALGGELVMQPRGVELWLPVLGLPVRRDEGRR